MTDDTLYITIESTAEFFDAAAANIQVLAASEEIADRCVLSLPDEAVLARLLSTRSLELLRAIVSADPESIRALARTVDRDVRRARGHLEHECVPCSSISYVS